MCILDISYPQINENLANYKNIKQRSVSVLIKDMVYWAKKAKCKVAQHKCGCKRPQTKIKGRKPASV
jgi:RNA-binding protein YlmH